MPFELKKTNFVNENRIIYLLKGKKNYVVKIFETVLLTDKEEENTRIENFTRQYQNIQEIVVYDNLEQEKNVVQKVYSIDQIKSHYHIFKLEDQFACINFKDWIKSHNLSGPYSMIITVKNPGYITFNNYINGHLMLKDKIISYFIRIMLVVFRLNVKKNFVHGDLLPRNVLVHESGNVKLFDFDISTIENNISIAQSFYSNFKIAYPFTGRLGFLLDFSRLYTSILFQYNMKCLFDNKFKILNDLVDITCIYDDLYIDSTNNLKYLKDWIEKNDGIDQLYSNVIEFLDTYIQENDLGRSEKKSVNEI